MLSTPSYESLKGVNLCLGLEEENKWCFEYLEHIDLEEEDERDLEEDYSYAYWDHQGSSFDDVIISFTIL